MHLLTVSLSLRTFILEQLEQQQQWKWQSRMDESTSIESVLVVRRTTVQRTILGAVKENCIIGRHRRNIFAIQFMELL